MSTFDLFLRVFFALQVGSVFLIVCAAMFHEFWLVVKRDRSCERCKKLAERKEPSLFVPVEWADQVVDGAAELLEEQERFGREEW